MPRYLIVAALGALLVSGCGGSPESTVKRVCMELDEGKAKDKSEKSCECMTAQLQKNLSSSDFSSLADELGKMSEAHKGNSKALGTELGTKMMTGSLVNATVSSQFMGAAKSCSSS